MNILKLLGLSRQEEPAPSVAGETAAIYGRLDGVARRFGYTPRRRSVSPDATPCTFFLGNHSSGKSTLINHLLGGEGVQDTGVAPTDDGFTVIMFGENEEDVVGLNALSRLPAEFGGLSEFGPNLVNRIRVKVRNREMLRHTMLVDTPGMIDTAGGSTERDYDFFRVVRLFADISDLVILMFDPDKPGTTGEAMQALEGPLSGMTYKLRILMNKCDLFESMYDYARAYGALCWNLARALQTKDLPKVLVCYVPVRDKPASPARLDVSDFDEHRRELEAQIAGADASRRDNIVTAALRDVSCLRLHVRMALAFRRDLNHTVLRAALASAAVVALATGCVAASLRGGFAGRGLYRVWAYIATFATAALAAWLSAVVSARVTKLRAKSLMESLDRIFEKEYRDELTLAPGGDLRQYWEQVRGPLQKVLSLRWWRMPSSGRRALAKIEKAMEDIKSASQNAARQSRSQ